MKLKDKFKRCTSRIVIALNNYISQLPLKTRKWILGFLGLAVAALCLTMIIRSIQPVSWRLNVGHDSMPVTILPPLGEPLLSTDDKAFLMRFRNMMDSLKAHDLDTYLKIINGREGLLDSVDLILGLNP